MPRKTQKRAETENRRKRVAAMYLRGMNQESIAEATGVSQATISRDVTALLKDWRERRERDVDNAVSKQIEELALMRRELWNAYHTDKDVTVFDRLMKIMERESKLLGLDAPKRTDITSGNEPLNIQITYVDPDPDADDHD